MRGVGRAIFAATLLIIAGIVNIVYGIGALSDANFFHGSQRYVFTNLNAMGWILVALGLLQFVGGFTLISGSAFGRGVAIAGAFLGAIAALFSISGSNPWWSLAVFFRADTKASSCRPPKRSIAPRSASRTQSSTNLGRPWAVSTTAPSSERFISS